MIIINKSNDNDSNNNNDNYIVYNNTINNNDNNDNNDSNNSNNNNNTNSNDRNVCYCKPAGRRAEASVRDAHHIRQHQPRRDRFTITSSVI